MGASVWQPPTTSGISNRSALSDARQAARSRCAARITPGCRPVSSNVLPRFDGTDVPSAARPSASRYHRTFRCVEAQSPYAESAPPPAESSRLQRGFFPQRCQPASRGRGRSNDESNGTVAAESRHGVARREGHATVFVSPERKVTMVVSGGLPSLRANRQRPDHCACGNRMRASSPASAKSPRSGQARLAPQGAPTSTTRAGRRRKRNTTSCTDPGSSGGGRSTRTVVRSGKQQREPGTSTSMSWAPGSSGSSAPNHATRRPSIARRAPLGQMAKRTWRVTLARVSRPQAIQATARRAASALAPAAWCSETRLMFEHRAARRPDASKYPKALPC